VRACGDRSTFDVEGDPSSSFETREASSTRGGAGRVPLSEPEIIGREMVSVGEKKGKRGKRDQ